METTKKALSKENLSQQTINTFVSTVLGGYPNPDDPQPPGPWDPVIRTALERVGPTPDPWTTRFGSNLAAFRLIAKKFPAIWDVIGGGRFDSVALNPQPLPPREAFTLEFARAVVDRLLLIQETADAIASNGDRQGTIVVGGRISQLVDEICGNNFPKKFPIPPRPGPDPDPRLTGTELVLIGSHFLATSGIVANDQLRNEFTRAGERLVNEGLNRI
jgi:hypothetical protein